MMGVPNLRGPSTNNGTGNNSRNFQCQPEDEKEAVIVLGLAAMGVLANTILMLLIFIDKRLRSWSQGLLFHQGAVDCGRAAILLPLGFSILYCEPIRKCTLIETAFLLLVTVSTINMLTIVLNDSPIFPEDDSDEEVISGPLLMDSPQCVLFGTFMIWFASIVINLGPTFLSGGLAARSEMSRNTPSCPIVHGPFRHYILNALWIVINVICVLLTLFHLHKLHRDLTKANVEAVKVAGLVTTLVHVTGGKAKFPKSQPGQDTNDNNNSSATGMQADKESGFNSAVEEHRRMRNYLLRIEKEGVKKVKMFLVITAAYVIFWGPLFFVTLARNPIVGSTTGYEVTLHVAYLHAFVNPVLFIILHRGLRYAVIHAVCCYQNRPFRFSNSNNIIQNISISSENKCVDEQDYVIETPQASLLVPPPPPPANRSIFAQLDQPLITANNSPHRSCYFRHELVANSCHHHYNENFSNNNQWEQTVSVNRTVECTTGPRIREDELKLNSTASRKARLIPFHKYSKSFSYNTQYDVTNRLHSKIASSLSLDET